MDYVQIGNIDVSRFILGSNPFSGFSHQGREVDRAMCSYFTTARIKQTVREAESLGVNTLVARADHHILRLLLEYRDEGGRIQWFAQTCPELGDHQKSVERAAAHGARACHLHGGVMDHMLAQGRLSEVRPIIDMIRERGMLAGIAGHNNSVFAWAEEHLDVDYYLCCYYNPDRRDDRPEHVSDAEEVYLPEDREAMTRRIHELTRPVIHYKIMAAGRNHPGEAFTFAARHMRTNDAVCVGVFPKDKPDMLGESVRLLEESLDKFKG